MRRRIDHFQANRAQLPQRGALDNEGGGERSASAAALQRIESVGEIPECLRGAVRFQCKYKRASI